MARYYNSAIRRLRKELRYASLEAARRQVERIRKLLPTLATNAVYPYEFVVEKVTGFRPQRASTVELQGETLIPDLLRLMYDISGRACLHADAAGEKVYTLEEVCRKYGVSARTVARWRQNGLMAMKFIWPDGSRRTGFMESALDEYVSRNAESVDRASCFSRMSEEERQAIIERARYYARHQGLNLSQVTQRLSDESGRSRETIRYTLLSHDRANPSDPIFESWREPLTCEQVEAIQHALANGSTVAEIARLYNRTPSAIYQILRLARARRLLARTITFVPNPAFEKPNADEEILGLNVVHEPALIQSDTSSEEEPSGSIYGPPPMSREEEAALFLRYNYLKYKAQRLQERLKGGYASQRVMDDIEDLLAQAEKVRTHLACVFLRLVIAVARRHVGRGLSLHDLISEGNLCLLRAIEKFDAARGNRFSTYLTWALIKTFARLCSKATEFTNLVSEHEELIPSKKADDRREPNEMEPDQKRLEEILRLLSKQERQVIVSRLGLEGTEAASYDEIARRLGVTKERARQIHKGAIQKLRERLGACEGT